MRPNEARAVGVVAGDAAAHVATILRDAHTALNAAAFNRTERLVGAPARPLRLVVEGLTAGTYAALRGGLWAGGRMAGWGARQRLLTIEQRRVQEGFEPLASISASPRGNQFVAAINGWAGDRLDGVRLALHLDMRLRVGGRDVEATAEGLHAAYPQAQSDLVVLLPGLMETEDSWRFRPGRASNVRGDYGAALAADTGRTALYLIYNTGRPVPDSGRALAQLLDQVIEHWPVPVRSLVLIGHSMGGLIIHSALAAGKPTWVDLVTTTITLGTPHSGAPLERLADRVERAATGRPALAWIHRPVASRSAGIRDLGSGRIADDLDGAIGEGSTTCAHHLVTATLIARGGRGRGVVDAIGDLIVPVASAHAQGRLHLTRAIRHEIAGLTHPDLLNHQAVYAVIRQAVAPIA